MRTGRVGLLLAVLALWPIAAQAQEWPSTIGNCNATAAGGVGTIDCSASLNIVIGDVLVGCVGTSTTTGTGGANTNDVVSLNSNAATGQAFTLLTVRRTTNVVLRQGYLIATVANAAATPRVTFDSVSNNRGVYIRQFRPAHPASFVGGSDVSTTGSSTTPTSVTASATGAANLLFFACARLNGGGTITTNSSTINGAASEAESLGGSTGIPHWWTTNLSTASTAAAASANVARAIAGAVFSTSIPASSALSGSLGQVGAGR